MTQLADGISGRQESGATQDALRTEVRAALTVAGISQASAARQLGLSQKHVSQMLTGRAPLGIGWADRILALCGLRLHVSTVQSDAPAGDPMPQPQTEPLPRGIGAIGVGMPALLHLEAFGREIDDAFGHLPCLVGSAATSKSWRDVDVRLVLPDAEFDALFPEHTYPARYDGRWGLLCAAISELARVRTGLPVDFQIQCQSIADECYPGVRYALGIHSNGGH